MRTTSRTIRQQRQAKQEARKVGFEFDLGPREDDEADEEPADDESEEE